MNSFVKKARQKKTWAIQFLNIAQFFGAVNDNVFKFLCVFFLISTKGVASSSSILFWVGTIYVLPFLLFSSAAGVLADRISKQKIVIAMKVFELAIALFGVICLACKSEIGAYATLFLLALQSALFGPAKYSIIPEIVPKNAISKANGVITAFTYLAIIFGTFFASFITHVTNKNFVVAGIACVVIALLGLLGSLLLPHTPARGADKKAHPFFLKEVRDTLRVCKTFPGLRSCIFGNAIFLYVGAFLQLNVIPLAIDSLGISEVGGGYLFLTVAIGIAIGAVLAGKVSRKQPEIGISCIASLLFCLAIFGLGLCHTSLPLVLFFLVLIGFIGGFFIVPLDAYLQTHSPDKVRGQIVATSNFMGFCGVLLAPLSIYLFSGLLHLSAAKGFLMVSLVVLLATRLMTARLSGQLFHFVARKLAKRLFTLDIQKSPFPTDDRLLLVVPNGSWAKALFLSICSPHIHFYFVKKRRSFSDWIYRLYRSVTPFYLDRFTRTHSGTLIDYFSYHPSDKITCLLLPKEKTLPSRLKQEHLYKVAFSFEKGRKVSIVFE